VNPLAHSTWVWWSSVVGRPLKTPKLDCTGGLIQRSETRGWYTPEDATNATLITTPVYRLVQAHLECEVLPHRGLPVTVDSTPMEARK
jgi:hypothetical protein